MKLEALEFASQDGDDLRYWEDCQVTPTIRVSRSTAHHPHHQGMYMIDVLDEPGTWRGRSYGRREGRLEQGAYQDTVLEPLMAQAILYHLLGVTSEGNQ